MSLATSATLRTPLQPQRTSQRAVTSCAGVMVTWNGSVARYSSAPVT